MAFKKVVLYSQQIIQGRMVREVYFDDFDGRGGINFSLGPMLAMGFEDQRSAYEFAGRFEQLQDWRVGLR